MNNTYAIELANEVLDAFSSRRLEEKDYRLPIECYVGFRDVEILCKAIIKQNELLNEFKEKTK